MNKMFKKLLVIGSIFGMALSGYAVNILSTNITGATTSLLWTNQALISEIYAVNAGTQSVVFTIFDAPSTSLTYTGGTYTNIVASLVSITNIYSDITAKSITNIYNGVTNSQSVVSAYTNNYPVAFTTIVPTNSSVRFTAAIPININRGILFTNKDSINLTLTFYPSF